MRLGMSILQVEDQGTESEKVLILTHDWNLFDDNEKHAWNKLTHEERKNRWSLLQKSGYTMGGRLAKKVLLERFVSKIKSL